ncbi:unnamed protein product [Brachionus calyciflorus]|uniref:Uncharacterized protein n=1 Tax=Brachionus calyciflorus TaxID=104777 RepID=A0A814DQI6_9BILA|nr:unnamed protein product [Brachionus calyciflorus]
MEKLNQLKKLRIKEIRRNKSIKTVGKLYILKLGEIYSDYWPLKFTILFILEFTVCLYAVLMIVVSLEFNQDYHTIKIWNFLGTRLRRWSGLRRCNIEPLIPIWLIVYHSVTIFMVFLLIPICFIEYCGKEILRQFVLILTICLTIFFGIFQLAWFIAGNVWVYSKYESVVFENASSSLYCDQNLYLLAFWTINVSYIISGAAIIIGALSFCGFYIYACCCKNPSNRVFGS